MVPFYSFPLVFGFPIIDYISLLFGCPLSDYIYDYMEGETIDGESMAVPMDLLWEAFNLGDCKEEMMTFWVNRFVLSTCYCLSNSDVRSEEKADFVEETCFESLEDLYYAAVLGLCVTYQY